MSNDRRRALRQDMRWEALVIDLEGLIVGPCILVNVSATGAKLILPEPKVVPDCFVLVLSKKGEVRRQCEVTWRSEKSIGVRFVLSVSPEDKESSFVSDMLARISSRNLVED
jgi:PilZ domain-containing protein